MVPAGQDALRRAWRGGWLSRTSRPLAAISALGLFLALASPHPAATANPQLRPAALAVQEGGGTNTTSGGKPWSPVGNPGDDSSWFMSPVGRMAYVFRAALQKKNPTGNYLTGLQYNIAIGFVDITGLKNLDKRGFQVMNASDVKNSDPALYDQLGLANRPGVQQFVVIPEVNEEKPPGTTTLRTDTLHAEQMIIFKDLSLLSPSDGGAAFTPDRFFAVYTDKTPCEVRPGRLINCADSMPVTTKVLAAVEDLSTGYVYHLKSYLDKAYTLAQSDSTFKADVQRQVDIRAAYTQANPNRIAKLRVQASRLWQSVKRLFETYPAAASAAASAAPCDEVYDAANPCPSADATVGASAAASMPGSGFAQVVAQPNVAAPGGIDFSRLQLDYLADPGDGSGLQYAFVSPQSASGGGSPTGALDTAGLASNAFFVWLEMDSSADWVNLNPTEPDRIVDAQVGRTDVGRIMLQADFALKKDVGTLIRPNTALGDQFWAQIDGNCFSSRVWVVPSPAQIYSAGDTLYILKAPLNVKMESDYIQMPKGQSAAANCPKQDGATQAHNEQLFRTLVLPKLVDMVNNDPSFADLRTIYRSRVAAEWYRTLSESSHTTYASLIDQGDISSWTTKTGWTPEQTFQQYVTSYTKGEYRITQRKSEGNYVYTYTYTYGGVDLTSVPIQQVSAAAFAADDPSLAQNVAHSLAAPTVTDSGMVLLGSPTPLQAARAAQPHNSAVTSGGSGPLNSDLEWQLLLSASLVLLAVIFAMNSRRRRRARKAEAATAAAATWQTELAGSTGPSAPTVPPSAGGSTWLGLPTPSVPSTPTAPRAGGATWSTPQAEPPQPPKGDGSTWSG